MKIRRVLIFVSALLAGALLFSIVSIDSESAPGRAAAAFSGTGMHKVIASPGLLDDGLEGVTLWQDYGSFRLYRLSDQALAQLPSRIRDQVQVADEMNQILIDASPFNSQAQPPRLPARLSLNDPSGPALQLVQFVGPIKAEWLKNLESAGIQPVHYIANNAYLVWTGESGRSRLNALASRGDFLQYSAAYQPYFKLGATLIDRVTALDHPDEVVSVDIQVYRHTGLGASEAVIKRLSLSELVPWNDVLDFRNVAITLRIADVATLANLPDVVWIGEHFPRRLMDEVQGQILAANFDAFKTGPSSPGYLNWLASHGFSTDPNDYPILDITDDGIGDGTVNSGDPTLYVAGNINNPSRLAYVQNCTSAADGGGVDGHGHLNASIAGGYDERSGAPYKDLNGFNLGLGINPFGRLAGTRIFTSNYDASRCGGGDTGVIQANYTAGARISSNSWGCDSCASSYDISSQAYDVGTRDADASQPGNQELVFVFSAGNSGPGYATIGTPGNAKNVITVGASESDRPTWTDGCSIGPTGADNAMDVIAFSSRGPAPGGRVKPELVAPGTHIQGTASTNAAYSGAAVCDKYMPGSQTVFAASSGTSHSAPAISGVASLYYYWLAHNYGITTPSPAMIKAYLVAHPTYLTGSSASDTLPSNSQGFGMPDMEVGLDGASRYLLDQSVIFHNSGETWVYNGQVADPSKPVRIVLAYTDQAGAPGTSPQVNDLNLQVVVAGTTYLGNHFSGQWSTPGGLPDTGNNIEAIFLPAGTSSSLDITITGFNIAGDGVPGNGDITDQDFALVCYNCAKSADFILSASPSSQDICAPGGANYNVTVGQVLGFSNPVALTVNAAPSGILTAFGPNPVTPPGASLLGISNTIFAAPGSYSLSILGTAQGITHTTSVGLNLFNSPPGQSPLQTPRNGATGQPTRPTFSWSAAAQGARYDIEIATDSAFSHVVDSETGLQTTSFTPATDLDTSLTYYWRVRSYNACGAGNNSEIFHFTTLVAPGDCPVGTTPARLLEDSFESGPGAWVHGGTGDTWSLSEERTRSGLQAFKAADSPSISDQQLVTPPVSLPSGQNPLTLRFWNYQSIEKSYSGDCYDGSVLEISTDGGNSWAQMNQSMLTDPYDALITTTFGNPVGGLMGWCGDPQDWLNSIVDLNAYAGQTVKFRFRLGTDDSFGREGWYIDDVAVQACQIAPYDAYLSPDSTRDAPPGGLAMHVFTLQNLGPTDTYTLTLRGNSWPTELLAVSPLEITAGTSLTLGVQVAVPPLALATLHSQDTFTMTVHSTGDPTLVLTAIGRTNSIIYPGVSFSGDQSLDGMIGRRIVYTFAITNTGDYTDTFTLAASGLWPWTLSANSIGPLAPGSSSNLVLEVDIPSDVASNAMDTTTLQATSIFDPSIVATVQARTNARWGRIFIPYVLRN